MPAHPKASKVLSTLNSLQHNIENQDPGSSALVRPARVRPGVSKIPVLAKPVHLQIPSDFTHSLRKWEEKPLTEKARSKKLCTRLVPFKLSQPKAARVASENRQPRTVLQTRTCKPEKNVCSSQLKTKNRILKPSATCENGKFRKVSENISQPLGQSGCLNPHKTSASVSTSSSSASSTAPASEQLSVCADACSVNMNRLTLTDGANTKASSASVRIENFDQASPLSIHHNKGVTSSMTPHSKHYNNMPGRVLVMKSRQKATPNREPLKLAQFTLDPAALRSILQNEGVKPLTPSDRATSTFTPQRVPVKKNCAEPVVGPVGSVKKVQFSPDAAALQSILRNEGVKLLAPSNRATSIFTPQRVPVKKNCAEPVVGPVGSVKKVQFFPDAAALQSILRNEGVKAGGPVGATSRNSACPSGRSTSVYMAQRVPVKKKHAALKESPQWNWSAQRVLIHRPMSAMKWHTMSQQSPYAITPGLKSSKANLCPKQEELVQRLFDDQDEQTTEQGFEPQTESLPDQTSPTKAHNKEKMQSTEGTEEEEEGRLEQDERVVGQPFIQQSERESVIFFSAGKRVFRDARFKKPEIWANNEQRGPKETLLVLQQSYRTNSAYQNLPKDILVQKTGAVNPALAILRKRYPPLEELHLDNEVATYNAVSGVCPLRPRCENPLASILLSDDSMRFAPISSDMPL